MRYSKIIRDGDHNAYTGIFKVASLRNLHARAGLLTAALILVTSCGYTGPSHDRYGVPLGPLSAKYMERQPLSHLYYPGSKPFYHMASGGDMGDNPAYAGAILASNATGEQIYAWYTKKLKSLGWSFVSDNGCADVQITCPGFGHDGHGIRQNVTIAIDDPTELSGPGGVINVNPPPACTIYEMSYNIYPPGSLRVPGEWAWNGGTQCWWTKTGWRIPTDVHNWGECGLNGSLVGCVPTAWRVPLGAKAVEP